MTHVLASSRQRKNPACASDLRKRPSLKMLPCHWGIYLECFNLQLPSYASTCKFLEFAAKDLIFWIPTFDHPAASIR